MVKLLIFFVVFEVLLISLVLVLKNAITKNEIIEKALVYIQPVILTSKNICLT